MALLFGEAWQHEKQMRASGGNRTHNPRITNAVLCQLKLRWPDGAGISLGERENPATWNPAQ